MELEGRRVAILAEDQYEDPELYYPYYRLLEAGAQVTVVGSGRAKTFTSKHGYPVKADIDASEARVEDFDAVIIPGGYSPDLMRREPKMVAFVRDMDAAGKTVAAICHAGWMLVSAGVLKGRRATSFMSIRDDMIAAGADYVDEAVVVDRNLVTSRFPADLPAFSRAIIDQLSGVRAGA
ncbi:MAG TPA: type 1 glutamine amidotransferase domain-containing protein [Candidatus Dormibacteraeota bacterium]|jgi:protease I|nr:type 1 glutamine amidotransferase domain-containing protein [Candidatus Dormibacteraeota bacterium]